MVARSEWQRVWPFVRFLMALLTVAAGIMLSLVSIYGLETHKLAMGVSFLIMGVSSFWTGAWACFVIFRSQM